MTTPPDTRDPQRPVTEEEETDFQRFLRNAQYFFSQYGTPLLLVILLSLLAYIGVNWYAGREERAREAAHTELRLATSPIGKQNVAQQYGHVPGLASNAYLAAADMLVRESLGLPPREDPGAQPQQLDEEEREQRLEQAAILYQRVIDEGFTTLLVSNARMGLAAVYENQGDFEAAAEQYRLVQEEGWPGHRRGAARSIRELDRLAEPVAFPEAPEQPDAGGQFIPGLQGDPHGAEGLPDLPSILPPDPDGEQPQQDEDPVLPAPGESQGEGGGGFQFDLDDDEAPQEDAPPLP